MIFEFLVKLTKYRSIGEFSVLKMDETLAKPFIIAGMYLVFHPVKIIVLLDLKSA
jgi:hypothetical protein